MEQRERQCGSLLHPHLWPHHGRSLRCDFRGGACDGKRPARCVPWIAEAESAARGCDTCPVPLACGHSAAGGVLGQIQSVCGGAWRGCWTGCVGTGGAGDCDERGFALLLLASAQARVCDARHRRDADQGASGDDGCAAGDCRGSRGDGLLPGVAAGMDCKLLPRSLNCMQKHRASSLKRRRPMFLQLKRVDFLQYFTIAVKESGLRLAPPTNAPSISSWPMSAVALSGFTLPP